MKTIDMTEAAAPLAEYGKDQSATWSCDVTAEALLARLSR